MKRARTFRGANAQMRQLGFAYVDFALHVGLLAGGRAGRGRLQPPHPPGVLARRRCRAEHAMIAGFTHLFADPVGYARRLLLLQVGRGARRRRLHRFRANGIFDRETGRRFRETILSRGDSDDPAELYRAFMGRDPDPDALLERLGL